MFNAKQVDFNITWSVANFKDRCGLQGTGRRGHKQVLTQGRAGWQGPGDADQDEADDHSGGTRTRQVERSRKDCAITDVKLQAGTITVCLSDLKFLMFSCQLSLSPTHTHASYMNPSLYLPNAGFSGDSSKPPLFLLRTGLISDIIAICQVCICIFLSGKLSEFLRGPSVIAKLYSRNPFKLSRNKIIDV